MLGAAWLFLAAIGWDAEPQGTSPSDIQRELSPTGGTIQIGWDAPHGCPGVRGVRTLIEAYVGEPLDLPRSKPISAEGVIVRMEDGTFRMTFRLESVAGVTNDVMVADECRTLADALALKVALAMDPVAVLGALGEPEPEPAPAVEPPPDPPTPAPPPPPERDEESRDRPQRVRGFLRPVGGVGFGPLPELGPGVALYGGVIFPWWRIELGVDHWFEQPARLAEFPDAGADIGTVSGHARLCPTPRVSSVELPVCAGVELGAMYGRGVGLGRPRTSWRAWAAIDVGPAIAWEARPWFALWAESTAVFALLRPGFRVEDVGSLYRAPVASARVVAGVEFRLK